MDKSITTSASWSAPRHPIPKKPAAPAPAVPAYDYALIEIVRTVAAEAARLDTLTLQQLQVEPCPLGPKSPLVQAARAACLERGYLADGRLPRGAAPEAPTLPIHQVQLSIEQGSSAWHDASEAAYHTFMPERRRIVYAAPVAVPKASTAWLRTDFIERVVLAVAEQPDLTSPDEYPDYMLVKPDVLRSIIEGVFESADEDGGLAPTGAAS